MSNATVKYEDGVQFTWRCCQSSLRQLVDSSGEALRCWWNSCCFWCNSYRHSWFNLRFSCSDDPPEHSSGILFSTIALHWSPISFAAIDPACLAAAHILVAYSRARTFCAVAASWYVFIVSAAILHLRIFFYRIWGPQQARGEVVDCADSPCFSNPLGPTSRRSSSTIIIQMIKYEWSLRPPLERSRRLNLNNLWVFKACLFLGQVQVQAGNEHSISDKQLLL